MIAIFLLGLNIALVLLVAWIALRESDETARSAFWKKHRANAILASVGLQVLIAIGAWLDARRQSADQAEVESQLRRQLAGSTDGGDSFPEVSLGLSYAKTNAVNLLLQVNGEYPLRGVSLEVRDGTLRYAGSPNHATNSDSEVVMKRFFGDIGAYSFIDCGDLSLSRSLTNYLQIAIQSLNGRTVETLRLIPTNNAWSLKLLHRERIIRGHRSVEPEAHSNTFVVF